MSDECVGRCEEGCVFCLSLAVERTIFDLIKNEPKKEGEVEDEDWFDDMVDYFRDKVMDTVLMEMRECETEIMIYNYGINRAFIEFARDMGGSIPEYDDYDEMCKRMLYHFIEDKMELNYENYKDFCERNE
jgi:hypothetical protein